MPSLLSAAAITAALARLPGWSGDPRGLTRSAELTAEQHADVHGQVMQRADAMNHHPEIERSGAVTRFTLSTHSAGGVTMLDLTLAGEIDEVLGAVVGDQPPGG